ncbi:MAG TPA: 4Fe-4S dicluster domain-containing protein [Candidatus Thioglobus sp.]|jgi:ferredoxin-type protein NapG|nr:4Fe-4S dicluster domain-containing protein [Candidatus Thioglobus sp.]
MKRRNFIVSVLGSTAAASIPFGMARLLAPTIAHALDSKHLLPPGALSDIRKFNAACIGCGLCGEVCPPNCIQFHKREGSEAAQTPYINPEEKACTLCGKCMEVCPTDALTVTERSKIDMGIAQIDRSACYPWVDKGICGACVAICPLGTKGIDFKMWNQYRPIVKDACVGCGLCVEICPQPSLPIRIVDRSKGTTTKHSI